MQGFFLWLCDPSTRWTEKGLSDVLLVLQDSHLTRCVIIQSSVVMRCISDCEMQLFPPVDSLSNDLLS